MTTDPSVIRDRLHRLDECLAILKSLAAKPLDELVQDRILLGSAERYLHVAIEACLDIANHIVAAENLRSPQDYADIFKALTEANILPVEFLPVAQRMARFRNRLVHLYWDIDAETIYEILQTNLEEFERFKGYILTFLSTRGMV